jgi:hypothetical protein
MFFNNIDILILLYNIDILKLNNIDILILLISIIYNYNYLDINFFVLDVIIHWRYYFVDITDIISYWIFFY